MYLTILLCLCYLRILNGSQKQSISSKISKKHKIKWYWVKAHAGDTFNEEVDELDKKVANLK